jgi:hypothetical protein
MLIDRILAELKEEFPTFRLVEKRNWFWKLLGFMVAVFTFGKNKYFLQSYITTVGPVIAVPVGWREKVDDQIGYLVLQHERIHIRQFKKLGFGNPWLGMAPMGFAYLLLPFPIGFAWCRYAFERAAYLEEAKIAEELYGRGIGYMYVNHAIEQLTGPNYGWAFPFPKAVRKWFEARF